MITTLTGPNHFLLQQELNNLVKSFVDQYGDLGLERLDGEETSSERLNEAAHSLPFLADKKLVIIKNPGSQKDFAEKIENTIKTVPESIDLVLVDPKIDKRSSYFKVLKLKTEYKEFTEQDSQKLNTWIVQYVKDHDGTISLGDANHLISRVGPNQQILSQELNKLLAYSSTIDRPSIDLLTEPSPQSSIFELLDSAFAGNNKKTLELYKQQRALKVEPQQIIAMLAWQLHILALAKTAGDKSPDQIAREAKISPFVARKSASLVSKLSLNEVKVLVRRALELDIKLKSQNINADEALQHFLLTLA